MAKSKSIIEAQWLDASDDDLRQQALALFENQRRLREQRKEDPLLIEAAEHAKAMYSEPASDLEKKIKTIRRVFRLRGMDFKLGGEK